MTLFIYFLPNLAPHSLFDIFCRCWPRPPGATTSKQPVVSPLDMHTNFLPWNNHAERVLTPHHTTPPFVRSLFLSCYDLPFALVDWPALVSQRQVAASCCYRTLTHSLNHSLSHAAMPLIWAKVVSFRKPVHFKDQFVSFIRFDSSKPGLMITETFFIKLDIHHFHWFFFPHQKFK